MANANEPKDITCEFTGAELVLLGLPKVCSKGEVLEDRLVEMVDVKVKKPGKTRAVTETHAHHFLAFRYGDDIWGVPYTKHEDGTAHFDEIVQATRYEYRTLLVMADEAA
jgi:hypothetical protein